METDNAPTPPAQKEPIVIPEAMREFNAVLIGGDGKQPIEKGWQNKIHKEECPKLIKHLKEGKNYGIQSNNSSIIINGTPRFLIIVDFDTKEFQDKVISSFPKTLTTSSGGPKNCVHLWLASNDNKAFKIKDENLDTLADLIGAGNQIIGPGSTHKSGSKYHIVENVPIAYIDYADLKAILKPYDKSPKKPKKVQKQFSPKEFDNKLVTQIYEAVSLKQILDDCGVDTSKNPTNCPINHPSSGKKCFSWSKSTAHCFHCEGSWNKFSLVREVKNLTDKATFEWFAKKAGMSQELKSSRKEYNKSQEIETTYNVLGQTTIYRQLAKDYFKKQPYFYDDSKNWWLWNFKKYCWSIKDKVDMMVVFDKHFMQESERGDIRGRIIEALKKHGRTNMPKEVKPTWVQLVDTIYDISGDEKFEATPKYFVANPIPWKAGKTEDTPKIDALFKSWVKEKDIPRLYELFAFTIVPKNFIHSFFFLYSPPGFGKSTFRNLLIKFIGDHNYCSTSIDRINRNVRFETKNWYKKLLVTMDEVNNVNQLTNSSIINGATGEDPVPCEFKGSNKEFKFMSYATFVYPTNKLLKIDAGDGFGRRVRKIDFKTRFEKERDVISEIPEDEFDNLARKCIRIAKELWIKRQFTGDVSISERMKNYQVDSKTPLEQFIDKCCDATDSDAFIRFDVFFTKYCKYMVDADKEASSKVMISKELRKIGWEIAPKNYREEQETLDSGNCNWIKKQTIFGLKIIGEVNV